MKRRVFFSRFLGISLSGLLGLKIAKAGSLQPILNVFLVADLSQENRIKDRQHDLEAMQTFFDLKGKMAGMDVRIQTFTYNRFSPSYLINAIKALGNISLNQAPNSGIAVYFSGHGANWGDEAFPHLSFGNETLAMSKLSAVVGERNPKLRFILADCCNHIIQEAPNKMPFTANPIDEDLVKKLFWNFDNPMTKKTVLICAAEKGEYSYSVQTGSIFQQMFRRAFADCTSNDNDNVSWETIKAKTVLEVKKFIERQAKITGFSYPQSPVFEIDSTVSVD